MPGLRSCSGVIPLGSGRGGGAGLAVGKWLCGPSRRRPLGQPRSSAARPPPAPRLLGLLVGCTAPSASPRSCCSAPPALGLLSWPPFAHLSGSQQEVLVRHVLGLTLERPRRYLASLGEGGMRCDSGSFPWGLGVLACTRLLDSPESLYTAGPSACSGRGLTGDSSTPALLAHSSRDTVALR